MGEQNERQYTTEEVTAIVRRALEKRRNADAIGHAELAEIARELSIDDRALNEAIRAQETEGVAEQARKEWLAKQRTEFSGHLRAFLIVNGFLLIVDLLTPGGPWFFWILICWGLGLAFDACDTFFPSRERVEKGTKRMLRKKRHAELGEKVRTAVEDRVKELFNG